MPEKQFDAVLTLTEAAAYLRVPEEELLQLAEQREIPSQRIGSEWRFLKRGLCQWLVYGQRFFRDYPPWFLDHPMLEELLFAIEHKLLQRVDPEKSKRGSKKAIREAIGVFKSDNDMEEMLASLSAIRKARSERVEE
jgi:excisionase family DNA binding protein